MLKKWREVNFVKQVKKFTEDCVTSSSLFFFLIYPLINFDLFIQVSLKLNEKVMFQEVYKLMLFVLYSHMLKR